MLRSQLFALVLVLLLALTGITFGLTSQVERGITVDTEERLKSSYEVVRLANQVDTNSLILAARAAANADNLIEAMQCPTTDAALAAANREQTPAVDPLTGQPVTDALGRPLDIEGQPIVATGRRCATVQNVAVRQRLAAWSASVEDARQTNNDRLLSERDPGFALARTPDLLLVTDSEGVVVARVGREMDNWFGPTRPNMHQFDIVRTAEVSTNPVTRADAGTIAWREYEAAPAQLTQVGVAPLYARAADGSRGAFLGTVIVGFLMTDASADEDRSLIFNSDVAYFHRDGGSTSWAGTSYASRPAFLDGILRGEFFQRRSDGTVADTAVDFQAISQRADGVPHSFMVDGRRYMVLVSAFSRDAQSGQATAGFIVVTDLSDSLSILGGLKTFVPAGAAVLFLLGVVGILFFIRTFTAPIEEISRGIQEVIAGNKDYMWPVDEKSHMSDMSHGLNIMSARLQGKKDPDSDDFDGDSNWAGMVGAEGGEQKRPAAIGGLGNIRSRKSSEGDGTPDA